MKHKTAVLKQKQKNYFKEHTLILAPQAYSRQKLRNEVMLRADTRIYSVSLSSVLVNYYILRQQWGKSVDLLQLIYTHTLTHTQCL